MRIKDKIKRPRRPVVVYEILPPREKDGSLNSYAANISSLLLRYRVDNLNEKKKIKVISSSQIII